VTGAKQSFIRKYCMFESRQSAARSGFEPRRRVIWGRWRLSPALFLNRPRVSISAGLPARKTVRSDTTLCFAHHFGPGPRMTGGQLFQFNMNGTAALLPALVNCVNRTKQFGIANAGELAA